MRPGSGAVETDGGTRRLVVAQEDRGARLDRMLATRLPELSRSRLKALILGGRVRVAGATVLDPARTVNSGEAVEIALPPPEPAGPAPEAIPLAIVYEDDALIAIDKPAGLTVHPGAGQRAGTLVNALIHHAGASLSGIGGVIRPGIVHRLDKDTTGLIVVAKTDAAHRDLAGQFADHGREGPLRRGYRALVWGVPPQRQGTIDAPIGRDPRNPTRMAVRAGGRRAVTRYRVERVFGDPPLASLLSLELETGRTHQIRVHLAHLGHPLVGDAVYGAGFRTKAARLPAPARAALEALQRQALHAYLLQLRHPRTGATLRFEAPLPADMAALVSALEGSPE